MTTSKFYWATLYIGKWPHQNFIERHFTLANDNLEISLGDVLHWQMTTLKFDWETLHWQMTTLKFHWATLYIGKWQHWNFIGRHFTLANDNIEISLGDTLHWQLTTSKFHWATLYIDKWPHKNFNGWHFTLGNDQIEISMADPCMCVLVNVILFLL